ncbi:hypothetical protein [Spiroplasma endosymbiont of Clivina fossor]|uniref:hypothetical protein n=1 Tax=Spiroplasma endosymbiont of Clivina fossor TaxID=3066282 RepID=UPI00313D67D4
MVDAKTIIFQDESLYGKFNLHVVSIGEPANENNLDELYIINSYTERHAPKSIKVTKETVLVRVQDFKVRGSNPIIVRIQKQLPEDTKVKAITIKFPRQALFGNIKLIGEVNGVEGYPRLFIENDKVMLPMLSMPIETEPKVRILQQWMSSQVLAWEKAKLFFNEKSALDLITVGGGTESRKKVFIDARVTSMHITRNTQKYQSVPVGCLPVDLLKENIILNETITLPGAIGGLKPSCLDATSYNLTKNYDRVELEFKEIFRIDSLQKVLLDMLDYTYNYRSNFKHAKYYSDEDKQFLYGQPKNAVAKLKEEKFVGQKPEIVITNLFEDWKFENPKLLKHPSVQIFKQIIMMLSEYIFSELSINMGLNDDYKLLLPYYFELISVPLDEDGYYKFKDVEVVLKSEYFDFHNNQIKLINNDISQNQLFKLNSNQFNWLPLINNLEPNDIPSLLPKDIKLADGNYGKNFVNFIIDKNNLNLVMKIYGSSLKKLLSNFEWMNETNKFDNINSCKFTLEDEIKTFKRLEVSAIFGKGKYSFEIETDDKLIKINNIDIFNDKLSSYSVLEI